jgi:hypothetical protein
MQIKANEICKIHSVLQMEHLFTLVLMRLIIIY